MRPILILLSLVALSRADTPANCLYEDIKGTWTFSETTRDGDNTLACDGDLGEAEYTKTITLSFPNTATDELGNEGTWTMIYNQGFEVNINERSYFAFSYYEGSLISATSYCDRTFTGWSRDKTVRNWSCFQGQKNTKVAPRITKGNVTPREDELFKNDHNMINKINNAQTSWTAKSYPEFEKYTIGEMLKRNGGRASRLPNRPTPAPATPEQKARARMLPENFDWRDVEGVNYVTPVRDQAFCGSCYVFASMGQLEARLQIATKGARQDVFSTQDVVECSLLSQGCDGGFNYLIAGRYAVEQGVVAEECNTYSGMDGSCSTDMTCSRTYVADGYEYVGGYFGACNEELMMEELVENGPMAVAFMVYDDFSGYNGGIYHYTGFKNDFNPLELTNHAVLLVGYGVDADTGEKYWTCKNSWDGSWGEDGFFRIRRGTDECAIESLAFKSTIIP